MLHKISQYKSEIKQEEMARDRASSLAEKQVAISRINSLQRRLMSLVNQSSL